jgi:hypothetical protein
MGLFEQAAPLHDGAGERPARMTEQLRLDEVVGQRRAVDVAESPIAARAQLMNRARDQLLADAAFPSERPVVGNLS